MGILKDRITRKFMRKLERERWINAVTIAAAECNRQAFHSLKNIYRKKDVVICGAGPSLSKYHSIDGAVHIALNRALLYDKVKFDYFFADDWEGINFIEQQILNYDCKKYFGFHFGPQGARIPESFIIDANAQKYYTDAYMFPGAQYLNLVVDIDKMAIANTHNIGVQIMQVALFMNPSRIYLVGIDASSNGHFSYEGIDDKRKKEIDSTLAKYVDVNSVKDEWLKVKELRDVYYPSTRIISINPIGLRGIFEDEFQDE